jgi:hypothetical protein
MNEQSRAWYESLREKSNTEVEEIILKYDGYQPAMVEAALDAMFDRGLISFELKEDIRKQAEANMKSDWNREGAYLWESKNAFTALFNMETDERIYDLIDNPGGMIIDAYHGLLTSAMERHLISGHDFSHLFSTAKKVNRTEDEILDDEVTEFYGMEEKDPDELTPEELEAERLRHWKCPSCGELSEMEFAQCWKCGAESPSDLIHPSAAEVIEAKKETSVTGLRSASLLLMAFGLLGLILLYARAGSFGQIFERRPLRGITVIICLVAGTVLFIKSLNTAETESGE